MNPVPFQKLERKRKLGFISKIEFDLEWDKEILKQTSL